MSSEKNTFLDFPEKLIGRQVEKKFKAAWHVGRIISYDVDEATMDTIWHVKYSDGDDEDYNAKEVTRVLVDEQDQLEAAERRLEQPRLLLGSRFGKQFQGRVHLGTIIDHDEDEQTGDVIWGVQFDDGDREDCNLIEITAGLLYTKTA